MTTATPHWLKVTRSAEVAAACAIHLFLVLVFLGTQPFEAENTAEATSEAVEHALEYNRKTAPSHGLGMLQANTNGASTAHSDNLLFDIAAQSGANAGRASAQLWFPTDALETEWTKGEGATRKVTWTFAEKKSRKVLGYYAYGGVIGASGELLT